MKTIHLIRHAKSSWKNATLTDHQRPLNKRGKDACYLMAKRIFEHGCHFDHVYASTAVRAQQTIAKLLEQLTLDSPWQSDEALYTFDVNELFGWLCQRSEDHASVVIIAHNPAMLALVNLLGDQEILHLPTCSYVQLATNVPNWQALKKRCAETVVFCYPKMFLNTK